MNIYITGFMGVGKSTVARQLALRLGLKWLDLDDVIQTKAGCTIRDIFDRFGESHFRDLELACLVDIKGATVISLGGGTFVQGAARSLIAAHGFSINLDMSFNAIWSRVQGKKRRPLVRSYGELWRLFEQRRIFYQLADATVALSGLENPRDVADLAMETLQ